ncbi:MAG TPA: flagellar filament capping protein FliD [Solirubrobacteraceae bacterium]|nr:flagellar filament capping protein FliD [Solirubrobacteraceae bacterium]
MSSSSGAPISFNGLASGLNTSEIITALLSAERNPIAHLTNQQTTLEGQHTQLQSTQSNLTQLTFEVQELGSPALFNSAQTVESSEPARISAATKTGAAVGGYEVEVTQLANSGQRTFTFKSPAAADTLTIDGHEISVAAGASIQDLVEKINGDSSATVYAAAVGEAKVVLSTRTTGATGGGFIALSDPGGTLTEQAGLAKEGRNAEYKIDGVAGSSASNTLSEAIPGVTLTLKALTSATGPVTIAVQPPGPKVSAIVTQVQSFVKLYNSTVGAIHTQITTKPPATPQTVGELQTGTLFGDFDLTNFLNTTRRGIYTPVAGLPAAMSSLANIGIGTGKASGSGLPSQAAQEGQLTLDTAALESALQTNPTGVKEMLQGWSKSFQEVLNTEAAPGGTLETRLASDSTQASELSARITTMNEMLAVRQKTLQAEFTAMEKVVSKNQAQASWLSAQLASMLASSASSSSSSSSSGH